MHLHCQDDSDIKHSRLAIDNHHVHLFGRHSNRSAPNLLVDRGPFEQHAPSSNGLRSHLHHLLPRHAYFHTRIQIHKVSNIPLVSGCFSVRWKVKNVHSPPGPKHGLLGMVKGRSRPTTPTAPLDFPKEDRSKNKEDGLESDDSTHSSTIVPSVVVSPFGPLRLGSSASSSVPTTRVDTPVDSLSAPPPPSSPAHVLSPDSSRDVMPTGLRPAPFNRLPPINLDFASPTRRIVSAGHDIPTAIARTPTMSSMLTAKSGSSAQRELASAARGQTTAAELKDHSVVWNHIVNTTLRIDVSRDSSELAPSPLKLIVVQHPIRNDPLSVSQNPRLGILSLNLAEYVDKGAVERKFLLKESKTNAIMKLTIELVHIGGAAEYIAPPLPQGEIMNGIASLLEKDLYLACLEENTRLRKELIPPSREASSSSRSSPKANLDGHFDPPIDPRLPFGMEGIPGAKSTAALIDALFNPVLTTEKEKEGPFTLYVSPEELDNTHPQTFFEDDQKRQCHNLEAASVYSTTSSSEDAWTTAKTVSSHSSVVPSESSSSKSAKIKKLYLPLRPTHREPNEVESPLPSAQSVKGWWRRIASKPATPTHT
ncbi:hypothetical protein AX15_000244 [Amanita polypyramis BW_CC]|nr:hypothetical protein AX15_000244 [Amanita polypyramis BW_CC]